jgi:hypothetical protein
MRLIKWTWTVTREHSDTVKNSLQYMHYWHLNVHAAVNSTLSAEYNDVHVDRVWA